MLKHTQCTYRFKRYTTYICSLRTYRRHLCSGNIHNPPIVSEHTEHTFVLKACRMHRCSENRVGSTPMFGEHTEHIHVPRTYKTHPCSENTQNTPTVWVPIERTYSFLVGGDDDGDLGLGENRRLHVTGRRELQLGEVQRHGGLDVHYAGHKVYPGGASGQGLSYTR